MRRTFLAALPLSLVLAACAGTTVEESFEGVGEELVPAGATTLAPPTDASPPPTDTSSQGETTATEAPKAAPEGPVAPDFTLALEPSGEFVLSQEVKPVYMVFWAEW